tara:strand:- start:680 stop:1444 length:765 start_codon:yes stop_codon:yes gene_type:complete
VIRGLEKFKERFAGLEEQYVLIGGTATYIVLDNAGFEPRATTDLDIVLCIEARGGGFGAAFWEFVKLGGYKNHQRSDEKPTFYRFSDPKDETFPVMLELLSRAPESLEPPEGFRFAKISMDDYVSSLSAILLDETYYNFLHEHKKLENGISIVNEKALIPLKALAWLNLTAAKKAGKDAKKKDINKHRSDIIRLHQLLIPEEKISTPTAIKKDIEKFLSALEEAENLNLKALGLGQYSLENIVKTIRQAYDLTE